MPTLYGVLGVDHDADEDRIVRAFRERAKRHHPDVSDAPDAEAQFKRLTVAKRVLTDKDERARYDRLGHETYVSRHLDGETWSTDGPTGGGTATAGGAATVGTGSVSEAAQRVAGESTSATAEPSGSQHTDRSDGYATASDYYRPGQRVGVQTRGGIGATLGALTDVLPWILAHLALLVGAIGVAVFLLAGTSNGGLPSVTSILVATAMVGITAGVSVLHITSTVLR